EIPPGKNLKPMRHLYEELILVLEGRGATQFWCEKTNQTILLEWQGGSLFSPPLNVKHQHFNGSATEPARFVAPSNAPSIFNAFASADFIFNTPYEFTDRFPGQNNYFSSEINEGEFEDTSINFISDIYAVPLTRYPRRGVDYSRLGITGSGNKAMVGHIMAIGSGTYRKPHYHGAGAQVIVLSGKGYTLMWPKDDPRRNRSSKLTGTKVACWCRPSDGITPTLPPARSRDCIWPCAAASVASAKITSRPSRNVRVALSWITRMNHEKCAPSTKPSWGKTAFHAECR